MGSSSSKTVIVEGDINNNNSQNQNENEANNNDENNKSSSNVPHLEVLSELEFAEPTMFRVVSAASDEDDNNHNQEEETSLSGFSVTKKGEKEDDDDPHKNYRILALEGESGCVFCRVHGDNQKTLPRISDHGTLVFATRTILRMKNITVARQLGRDRSMFGPLDYLADLEEPHNHLYTIELPKSDWPQSERFPKFISHPRNANNNNKVENKEDKEKQEDENETTQRRRKVTPEDCVIVDAKWISGKRHKYLINQHIEEEYKKKHGIERVFGFSVFPDPGLLECSLVSDATAEDDDDVFAINKKDSDKSLEDQTIFNFPIVDATELDMEASGFKCRIVRNDTPFQFLADGDEYDKEGNPLPSTWWPRPVTYNFQPKYAHEAIYGPDAAGLFLETHDFTQSMTPVNPDGESCGFIVIGKWMDDENENDQEMPDEMNYGTTCCTSSSSSMSSSEIPVKPSPPPKIRKLQLIALKIPYGWTIIIDKQCIHGDTTFSGLYAMSMTTNHVVMGTADTVFVKHAKSKKNIDFSCIKHYEKENTIDQQQQRQNNNEKPHPVPVREGIVVYTDATREELEKFDQDTKGASFILQPFSKLSWTTTMFRRFGWYPGMPSPVKKE